MWGPLGHSFPHHWIWTRAGQNQGAGDIEDELGPRRCDDQTWGCLWSQQQQQGQQQHLACRRGGIRCQSVRGNLHTCPQSWPWGMTALEKHTPLIQTQCPAPRSCWHCAFRPQPQSPSAGCARAVGMFSLTKASGNPREAIPSLQFLHYFPGHLLSLVPTAPQLPRFCPKARQRWPCLGRVGQGGSEWGRRGQERC